jgi:hypothetical protein
MAMLAARAARNDTRFTQTWVCFTSLIGIYFFMIFVR